MLAALLCLVFVATFSVVVATVAFVDRRRLETNRVARARLEVPVAAPLDGAGSVPVDLLRAQQGMSGFAAMQRLLERLEWARALSAALASVGSRQTAGQFVLVSTTCGAAGLALGAFMSSGAAAAALVAIAAGAPTLLLRAKLARRRAAIEAQMPEMLDIFVSALRAGYSLNAAIDFAATETPAPLGAELSRLRDEQRVGVVLREALTGFGDRVGTAEARMFVTALLVHRDTGGNLAELLGKLSDLVRERVAFRGRVAALTAEARMSARVLGLLPLAMLLLLLAVNPVYMRPMVAVPLGRLMLLGAGLLSLAGYAVMRAAGDVEL